MVQPGEGIIRLERSADAGAAWHVFGLNLFVCNRVEGVDPLGPSRHLLSCLLRGAALDVLVGGLAVEDETWPSMLERPGERVGTTLLNGEFQPADPSDLSWAGVFYRGLPLAKVLSPVWERAFPSYNAVAIVKGARSTDAVVAVLNSFSSPEALQQGLADLAELVVVSGHDAIYLDVVSRVAAAEQLLGSCCQEVEREVARSQWYQRVKAQAFWDEEQMCMMA